MSGPWINLVRPLANFSHTLTFRNDMGLSMVVSEHSLDCLGINLLWLPSKSLSMWFIHFSKANACLPVIHSSSGRIQCIKGTVCSSGSVLGCTVEYVLSAHGVLSAHPLL